MTTKMSHLTNYDLLLLPYETNIDEWHNGTVMDCGVLLLT